MMRKTIIFGMIFGISMMARVYGANIWEPLEEACQKAGGKRFSPVVGCECPGDHQVFSLQNGKSECRRFPIYPKGKICKKSGCTIDFDRMLFLDENQSKYLGSRVTVKFEKMDEQSQFMDAMESDSYLALRHPFDGYRNDFGHIYYIGGQFPIIAKELHKLGLTHSYMPHHRYSKQVKQPVTYWNSVSYYSPDSRGIENMIGLEIDDQSLRLAFSGAPSDNPYQEELKRYFDHFIKNLGELDQVSQWTKEIFRGDSCKDICRLSIALPESRSWSNVSFHQEIVYGSFQKRFLVFKEEERNRDLVVQLTPSLFPSIVILRQRQGSPTSEIKDHVIIFDRSGKKLDEDWITLQSKKKARSLNRITRDLDENRPRMILCEGFYIDDKDWNKVKNNLIRGPSMSPFGWSFTGDRLYDYFSDINWSHFSTETYTDHYPLHMVNTISAAASAVDSIQVMPSGGFDCIQNFNHWREVPGKYDVRVASISSLILYHYDEYACHEHILNKINSSVGKSILWVQAAGNDNEENPQYNSCLGKGNLDNVLVVGATRGESAQIASYSNFGTSTVDILASGNIDGKRGTSFSAPKVAALAAKIALEYPRLTPKKIKQAILIGATFDSKLKGKVRSGSHLIFEKR